MPETDKAAEKALSKLRRLPENRICPNCLTEDAVGFTAICMQFKTFVCSDCKSAHQSFSHRTKSSSQSVWKMEEVKALDERNGGGNKLAQERWLANVPDSERPIPGSSPPQVYKNFIERAYMEERWAGSALAAGAADAASEKATSSSKSSGGKRRDKSHKKDRKRSPRHTELAAPDENQWQLESYGPVGQLAEAWTANDQLPEAWTTPEFGEPLAYSHSSPGPAFAAFNESYASGGFQYGANGAVSDNGSPAQGWGPRDNMPQSSHFEQFFQQRSPSLGTPQTARTAGSRRAQPPTPAMSDRGGWTTGMHAKEQRMATLSPMGGSERSVNVHRGLPSWLRAAPASPNLQSTSASVSGAETGPALSVGNTTLRLKPTNPWASSIGGRGSAPKEVQLAPNNPWADAVADSGRSARTVSFPSGSSAASSARSRGNHLFSNSASCGASDAWAGAQPPQANPWVDAC